MQEERERERERERQVEAEKEREKRFWLETISRFFSSLLIGLDRKDVSVVNFILRTEKVQIRFASAMKIMRKRNKKEQGAAKGQSCAARCWPKFSSRFQCWQRAREDQKGQAQRDQQGRRARQDQISAGNAREKIRFQRWR